MAGITCSSLIVCVGIKILTMKKSMANSEKQAQLKDQFLKPEATGNVTNDGSIAVYSENTGHLLEEMKGERE